MRRAGTGAGKPSARRRPPSQVDGEDVDAGSIISRLKASDAPGAKVPRPAVPACMRYGFAVGGLEVWVWVPWESRKDTGMSCPSWQWHRTGYRWSPVRTLPLAPLRCDLDVIPEQSWL